MARKGGKDRGLFEKKPGEWWIRYTDGDGREHKEKVGPKKLAREAYQKRKIEVREGKFFPEKVRSLGPLFEEALDRFLSRHQHDWKAWKEWNRIGGKWKERFAGRRLKSITKTEIDDWLADFAKAHKPGTVNRHLTLLKSFFNDSLHSGLLDHDPSKLVRKLKGKTERVRFLSEAEEPVLMAWLTPAQRKIVRFAILTGLRQSEQAALQWDDVDLERRVLTVRDSKNGESRVVPLSQEAVDILHWFQSDHRNVRVFPLNFHNLYRRVFRPAVEKAGIKDLSA